MLTGFMAGTYSPTSHMGVAGSLETISTEFVNWYGTPTQLDSSRSSAGANRVYRGCCEIATECMVRRTMTSRTARTRTATLVEGSVMQNRR